MAIEFKMIILGDKWRIERGIEIEAHKVDVFGWYLLEPIAVKILLF